MWRLEDADTQREALAVRAATLEAELAAATAARDTLAVQAATMTCDTLYDRPCLSLDMGIGCQCSNLSCLCDLQQMCRARLWE